MENKTWGTLQLLETEEGNRVNEETMGTEDQKKPSSINKMQQHGPQPLQEKVNYNYISGSSCSLKYFPANRAVHLHKSIHHLFG